MITFVSTSADQTWEFGRAFARQLRPGDIVCFYGDLGSGKTTMIKGMAQGLRVSPEKVHSPTFTLLNIYDQGRVPLYHFDLYRIADLQELFGIGYDEFLFGSGISVIEWSERFGPLLPEERLEIHLKHKGEDKREVKVRGAGEKYRKIVESVERRV